MSVKSHYDLKVWQASINLAESVYNVTKRFPVSEQYGLTSQIRRSAVSIASNIAEGSQRESTKDLLRFLSIAKGSVAELETQLIISEKVGYINQTELKDFITYTGEINRMLSVLQRNLKSKDIAA